MRRIEPSLISVAADEVIRAQGADPDALRSRRPALWAQVCDAIALGQQVIQPAVWVRTFPVAAVQHNRVELSGGQALSGELVVDQLAGAERVVVGLTTLGAALDELIRVWMERDVAFGFLLDAYGSVAAEKLSLLVQEETAAEACAGGASVSMAVNPGMTGWPVDQGQPQIFRALQPDAEWIRLTPAALILPRKSCSFVLGIGQDLARGAPCDYCAARDRCVQRNARSGANG
ncbi:MAG TPA: hypothetical protein VFF68_09285 [Anaerolineaceae bacterium]|nr:hypothetical protein [Anaerolineaceae bacterium]